MTDETNQGNQFMVGVSGARIVILKPPRGSITKDEALNLAAWIVALADDNDRFADFVHAACSS